MGAVTSKISEPRLRGIAVPSPRANPQSARPLGKLSMHRRRRHGHVRIFGLGLQNEPIGPQLRFLPGCQKPAADPALRAARASFHRDRLGDFIGCEAGRAGDVGYFHRSNMIGFADGFLLRDQCDTKKAGRKILFCFDARCRLVFANSDRPASPHSDLSTFQNTGVAGPSSTPVSDVRQAAATRYCPSGT